MNEQELLAAIDLIDRDLDNYPFWSSFKSICSQYPVEDINNLTPGRQAILIFWKATMEKNQPNLDFLKFIKESDNIHASLNKLKSDLINNFFNQDINENNLHSFFKTIASQLR